MKMDEKKQPGVIFRGVFIKSLNFNLNEAKKQPKPLRYSFGANFEHAVSPDKKKMKATLTVNCMDGIKNPPFDLVVSIDGYFETAKEGNLSLKEYAKEMAPALLMPFVREIIANITSRIPYPPILLPPINIHALLMRQKRLK